MEGAVVNWRNPLSCGGLTKTQAKEGYKGNEEDLEVAEGEAKPSQVREKNFA